MMECKKGSFFLHKGQVHDLTSFLSDSRTSISRNIAIQDPRKGFTLCQERGKSCHQDMCILQSLPQEGGLVVFDMGFLKTLTLRIHLCLKGIAFCL